MTQLTSQEEVRVRESIREIVGATAVPPTGRLQNTLIARFVRIARWGDNLSRIALLAIASIPLLCCSCSDRKVVLTDESGTRKLVYSYRRGFVPQAQGREDIPLLRYSGHLALVDAVSEKDTLSAQSIRKAMLEADFRGLERAIVEYRFSEIAHGKGR